MIGEMSWDMSGWQVNKNIINEWTLLFLWWDHNLFGRLDIYMGTIVCVWRCEAHATMLKGVITIAFVQNDIKGKDPHICPLNMRSEPRDDYHSLTQRLETEEKKLSPVHHQQISQKEVVACISLINEHLMGSFSLTSTRYSHKFHSF